MKTAIAESFARIVFSKTGDEGTLDFDNDTPKVKGVVYQLNPLGEVRPVIDAGELFNYARKTGDDRLALSNRFLFSWTFTCSTRARNSSGTHQTAGIIQQQPIC